jgi:alpha-glucosidase
MIRTSVPLWLVCLLFSQAAPALAEQQRLFIASPNGRNAMALEASGEPGSAVQYKILRDGDTVFGPSPLGPVLAASGPIGKEAKLISVESDRAEDEFSLPWGKTQTVREPYGYAQARLESPGDLSWQVELRAYDDGVAFRYRLPEQGGAQKFTITGEATSFQPVGNPRALFTTCDGFQTSHEALYGHKPLSELPLDKLIDMPLLLTWPDGQAAAITEARVREFAGMYLQRSPENPVQLTSRLAPLPGAAAASVEGTTPHASPWRVVLLGDNAGKLLESNLLLCLNEPPEGDFAWCRPGKTSFHWWNGAFEEDYKLPADSQVSLDRHKRYIDFCARHNIAYHGVSGDGRAWYVQSSDNYAVPSGDADVLTPRPELRLPEILEYAREQGVGVRLWVHWKPLREKLEEAFTLYEQWGVKGLMVDFLDRDDQEMLAFVDKMLKSAARHKLHIQIHGSSKYSGEQRTFPNLFNREGVLNLEYLKWSDLCTPDHSVNVAYTRALAGPVDYHLGGFRSVSRAEFKPQDRAPVVLGTRCHHMALYVVYENPMPMVADEPSAYEGEPGFDFVAQVPVTWEETRFVAGEPGEYIAIARRSGDAWYVGAITDWTPREVDLPLSFLENGRFKVRQITDGSMAENRPNDIAELAIDVDATKSLSFKLAPGGGGVAIIRPDTD